MSLDALVVLVLHAAAQDMSVSSVSRVEAHGDNLNGNPGDDDYLLLQERADLSASIGHFRSSARLDGDLFFDQPDDGFVSGLTVERLAFQWDLGDVGVTVGDFSAQLGRGIALSVRRVPDVGADNAIRGARIDYRGDALELTGLFGLANPANVDAISRRHVDDPGDFLSGAELKLVASERLTVGALGSFVLPAERALLETTDWTMTAGAFVTLDDVFELATLALEVDVQERSLAGVMRHGAAVVADIDVKLGDSALLFEGLYLSGMEVKGSRNTATGARFDYNQPPTLERIDQEVQNNRDVVGGRARIDLPLTKQATLFASAMTRVGEIQSPTAIVQAHAFIGADLEHDGTRLSLTTGARSERLGLDKLAELRDMVHLDGDALILIGRGFGIHNTTTLQLWRASDRPFARGSSLLALERRGYGSIGVEAGIDTQDPSMSVRHLFLAATTAYAITPDLVVRATAGSQRGGVKCVSGVCRELPAFSGAKAEVEVRF